jgi:DNA gyrase subunit B
MSKNQYDAGSIVVMKGYEAVRKRPGMYVGDTGSVGLTRLALHRLSELAGCEWTLSAGDSVEFAVTGPQSWVLTSTGQPPAPSDVERFATELHAGACACPKRTCRRPDTLDLAVLNALSERLDIDLWFAGEQHQLRASRGRLVDPRKQLGVPTSPPFGALRGTRFVFTADPQIFRPEGALQTDALADRMRTFAAARRGATFSLVTPESTQTWTYPDGLAGLIRELGQRAVLARPLAGEVEVEGCRVEFAANWEHLPATGLMISTANTAPTPKGGPHVETFVRALTQVIGQPAYALTAAVAISMPESKLRWKGCIREELDAPWLAAPLAPRLIEALEAALAAQPGAADVLRLAIAPILAPATHVAPRSAQGVEAQG